MSPPERIAELDEAELFDDRLHQALAAMDLLRLGLGIGDLRDQLIVIEELGAGPTSMAAFLISHYAAVGLVAGLGGPAELVDAALAGQARISFALSEPDGGTDVARVMRTRAAQASDGWRVTGTKLWTSGAVEADAIVVFARTAPIQRSPADGITMFLVPRDAPGLSVRPLRTFGIRGMSTCEVHLDEVAAPVLGPVDGRLARRLRDRRRRGPARGGGLHRRRPGRARPRRLVRERPRRCSDVRSVDFRYRSTGWWTGRSRSRRHADCCGGQRRSKPAAVIRRRLASMAKLAASEAAVTIAQHGMQLMGGLGYTRDVAMQRFYRDARLWTFSPLTNEMVRNSLGERLLGLARSY